MTSASDPIRVTTFGPNLSGPAQRKGHNHVHTEGCADCKKYGPGKPMGGEDNGYTIEAMSLKDVVLFLYPPEDFNYEEDEWQDYNDTWVAPCVRFPS